MSEIAFGAIRSSTRYAMLTAKLGEYLTRGACTPMRHVVKALANGLMHVGAGYDIEQPLIRFSILQHRFCLTLYGEQDGTLFFLSCFMN